MRHYCLALSCSKVPTPVLATCDVANDASAASGFAGLSVPAQWCYLNFLNVA